MLGRAREAEAGQWQVRGKGGGAERKGNCESLALVRKAQADRQAWEGEVADEVVVEEEGEGGEEVPMPTSWLTSRWLWKRRSIGGSAGRRGALLSLQ
jgi:hypothetical protein